eukprot:gnl/TRDRNA2_/TRDRNA2_170776_c0_seq2.p2 gnl/TRDRNA2_/TRDRNA2_170776_c0~~gnl/TRDRNA2_/TRDRNA2_170776_c0_seq2.p2  ORF type:complete len:111 (-),score=11.75 gnl/TRDRNA2_/TRDRNA2_170776_c0_seq2:165-497(-)
MDSKVMAIGPVSLAWVESKVAANGTQEVCGKDSVALALVEGQVAACRSTTYVSKAALVCAEDPMLCTCLGSPVIHDKSAGVSESSCVAHPVACARLVITPALQRVASIAW